MINPLDRPVPEQISIEQSHVYVLCEGVDEAALIRAVAVSEGLNVIAGICSERGNFEGELRQFALAAPRFLPHALGVVVDKETDEDAAEARLRKWLTSAGFVLPAKRGEVQAAAIANTDVRLGYFLNPVGSSAGAIEQLFVQQIDTSLSNCINLCLECMVSSGLWANKKSVEILKDKVRLRFYLAAKKGGGNTGLNVALQDGILTVNDAVFEEVRRFLHALCQQ